MAPYPTVLLILALELWPNRTLTQKPQFWSWSFCVLLSCGYPTHQSILHDDPAGSKKGHSLWQLSWLQRFEANIPPILPHTLERKTRHLSLATLLVTNTCFGDWASPLSSGGLGAPGLCYLKYIITYLLVSTYWYSTAKTTSWLARKFSRKKYLISF
jgi:hypothetical protein